MTGVGHRDRVRTGEQPPTDEDVGLVAQRTETQLGGQLVVGHDPWLGISTFEVDDQLG
ncbi:MAG: hypothetical protein R2697_17320 [Ilumatobacteraceae bacterium]